MISLKNTRQRYGVVAITLHWLMMILLVGLVVLGLYMVSLPEVGFDTVKIVLILYHKNFGVLALFLGLLRLAWRLGNVLPRLVAHLPHWQKVAARFVHLCFYAVMFALPMTGWLMSSAADIPVSFFGLFTLPDLISPSDYRFRLFVEVHKWLGYLLIGLFLLHSGAALRHHFIIRDDTLKKMLPRSPNGDGQPVG